MVYQYTPNFLEEIVLWDILEEGQIENLPDEEETDETGEVTDPTSDIADSDENEDAKADREDTDETPSLEVELPTSEELPTLQEEVVQQNRVEVMNSTNPVVTLV
ncbi:MAG: hypothetical protein LBO09_07790 [Candidatus Peribacteria bacterium]|nr:hypothetical protein [Candidatus Peribacteria bacterium]